MSNVDDGGGFAARLRACREAAGLSQQQLAERSGLSIRAVSNMERGRTQWPYRDSLARLADALGLRETARAEFLAAVPRRQLATPPANDTAPAVDPSRGVPQLLPGTARHFTGRTAELAELDQLLAAVDVDVPGTAAIAAICGTAGVGKSALALTWAHQVAEQFPDGQLYVNLRGYDSAQPLAPGQVLARFLDALGVAGAQIPAEVDDRAAAFRSMLAGRRMLVVLDNARVADEIRPLLPGTPRCATLVTSRDALAGLVARDGAVRLELDALPLGDAVALLRKLIGQRTDSEPQAAARLAELCCRLPLPLRVAAEFAARQPMLRLAALADNLAGHSPLDLLDAGGDQATAIRAVFTWSYQSLSAGTARTFRLTSLHPGTEFDIRAAAALTNVGHEVTRRSLAELIQAHMLWSTGQDRYATYDLLRAYAIERATADDDETSRRAALTRLFDHYLGTAVSAARILYPADVASLPPAVSESASAVAMTGELAARTWLDAERANLTASAAYAANFGWSGHALGLSAAMFQYLATGGHLDQALAVHEAAVRSGQRSGDRLAEARSVNGVGAVYLQMGRFSEAEEHLQRALALSSEGCDSAGQLRALLNLGQVYLHVGDYPRAAASSQQALDLSRSTGNRSREDATLFTLGQIAVLQGHYRQAAEFLHQAAESSREAGHTHYLIAALNGLGHIDVRQGRYHEARRHLKEAAAICRQTGHAVGEAEATGLLGAADLREGRHQQAARRFQRALEFFRDAGIQTAEAEMLRCLAEVELKLGRPAAAAALFEEALVLFRDTAASAGEADARNGLGDAALERGAPREAIGHHQRALAIASQIKNPEQEGYAQEGLGNASAATGDLAAARRHWEQALALYAKLDIPEAERVRARLASPAPVPAGRAKPLRLLAPDCAAGKVSASFS